jgi:hypothetical protein
MMMVLVLAGIALAFSTQGAAARGGSSGVTVVVNGGKTFGHRAFAPPSAHRFTGQRFDGHRFTGHRFSGHHMHGTLPDEHHSLSRLQRSTPHAARLHHSGRAFDTPHFHRFAGHDFKGPRVLSFQRPESKFKSRFNPRFKSHGVIVVRPSTFDSFVRFHRAPPHPMSGGKLIILRRSLDGSRHIAVVPPHRHWAD